MTTPSPLGRKSSPTIDSRTEDFPDDWGTAVNVQSMVFGNMGDTSATGVAFSRNPANGDNKFYGEWLINAQGEDVVAGIRTPNPLNEATKSEKNKDLQSLETAMPEVYRELDEIRTHLENHFHDMQDIEFTIQEGKLWMLQCRIGKRTGLAALQMATDMLAEGMIDEKTAVMRVSPAQLDEILHPILDSASEKKCTAIAQGLPASPGGAVGTLVFTPEDAVAAAAEGRKVILVREETSPEDIEGMRAASGILTVRGGMTSHAALVARGWGKCCIVGCDAMKIDLAGKKVTFAGTDTEFKEGDWFSLNGAKGLVYNAKIETMDASENPLFVKFMALAFLELGISAGEGNLLACKVDLHCVAAYDAALAPSAGNESSVGGHTSAGSKDTCRSPHTLDILRRSLLTDKNGLLACSGGLHGSL